MLPDRHETLVTAAGFDYLVFNTFIVRLLIGVGPLGPPFSFGASLFAPVCHRPAAGTYEA